MNQELDMSGVAVDMMERPSLKYVRLHLGNLTSAYVFI